MPVGELLTRVSSAEIAEWMALAEIRAEEQEQQEQEQKDKAEREKAQKERRQTLGGVGV